MSDSEFILRITGDASGVQEAADQAKEQIERAAQSVSMLGDLIGVKVPEGVQKLIASSELLGPALEAAFPIVAAVSLVDVLVQIGEKLADLDSHTEENRQAWVRLNNESQDTTTKILTAIDQQKQKYVELTQGPIAALEFELGHMRSIAIEAFRAIEIEMSKVAEQMAKDGGWLTEGARANKQASEDIKKTLSDMDAAVHDAAMKNPKDLLAPFEAELAVINKAIAQTNSEIQKLPTTETKTDRFTGSETVQVNQEKIASLTAQLNLFQQIADQIRQQETLQKETLKVEQTRVTVARSDQAQKADDARSKAKADAAKAIRQLNDQELADSEKNDKEALKSFKDSNDQIIAAANERFELEATKIQGEIDASKIAEQTKEQLIQQSFLKGQITRQQEIQEIANAKVQELQKEVEYLRQKEQFWYYDAKKVQEIENQITKIIEQQKLIRAKADTDSLKTEQSNLQKRLKDWQDVNKQMEDSYLQMMDSMNSALLDFVKTGKFNWQQMATQMVDDILRVALQWGESQILMKVLGIQSSKETAASGILDSAAAGAAAAGASVAAIPVVGWTMVEPVAAATYTQLAAYAASLAAHYELGGVVPATGLALVHQGEKILPRSMSGNGSGLGGPAVHVHVNLNALDAESFRGTVSRHGNIIANEVAKVLRRKGFCSG